jgi:hypothetical protein
LLRLNWKAKGIEHSAKRETKKSFSHEFPIPAFSDALCSTPRAPSYFMILSARASTLGGFPSILDFRWFDMAHHRFWILDCSVIGLPRQL